MSVETKRMTTGRLSARCKACLCWWLSHSIVDNTVSAFQFGVGAKRASISVPVSYDEGNPILSVCRLSSRIPSTLLGMSTATTEAQRTDQSERINDRQIEVVFVSGSSDSGYGATSPLPNPSWSTVAAQLSKRLPNFSGTIGAENGSGGGKDVIAARSIDAATIEKEAFLNVDVVVVLGVTNRNEEDRLVSALTFAEAASSSSTSPRAILVEPGCTPTLRNLRRAGSYRINQTLDDAISTLAPWTPTASGKRLLSKTDTLLGRKSSEDHIFAVLFAVHGLLTDIDVVKSDINPSWDKGVVRNVQEFRKMTDCCGPQIAAALSDPQTKQAIDLLNAVDLRDQVGSYRVIVSNETPELEEFTLCILQQNDCFNCDAPILQRPVVPLLTQWRGRPLDDEGARQILMGHLDHPSSHELSQKKPWSWKIVVGANPAYDAFPMQHQIFYPCGEDRNNKNKSGGSSSTTTTTGPKSLWYDPVFCVETLDNQRVWCKRHYRCTPRKHRTGTKTGSWTFTTLDNGMMSEEHWTTVDCADDLSWAVLHYSGAARRAGQSYVGALLCTMDGQWPETAREGEELERIRKAFRNCDLELWELFGGSTTESYMWGKEYMDWKEENPPDLGRIGDISVAAWRKQEREKSRAEAGK